MQPDSTLPVPYGQPLKPVGRTLAEFEEDVYTDGLPLWPAERKLLEAVRKGEDCDLRSAEHEIFRFEMDLFYANPKEISKLYLLENEHFPKLNSICYRIRAGFLRFLLLGGDHRAPVHEKGVRVRGAWVIGDLDIEGCQKVLNLYLFNSIIEGDIILRDAKLGQFALDGTWVNSIHGDRVHVMGGISLRNNFVARGLVRLAGAKIDGPFDCTDGNFVGNDKNGQALILSGAKIKGDVCLQKNFFTTGKTSLVGIFINGNLVLDGGRFICNSGSVAIAADGAHITDAIMIRDIIRIFEVHGSISFVGARAGALIDQIKSWPAIINIDGFEYSSISVGSSIDPASRIEWLDKSCFDLRDFPFSPKPWEQLIKVLRASGHEAEARKIAIAKEDRLRKDSRIRNRKAKDLIRWPAAPFHALFGLLAGYGYAPFRLVGILTAVWLACAGFFLFAAEQGVFSPTSPLVFQNPALAHCSPDDDEAKRRERALAQGVTATGANAASIIPPKFGNWYLCPDLPAEYTTFDALLYSLDLILPLVELQQDKDWAPMICTPRDIDGSRVWLIGWFKSLTLWDNRPACGLRSFTRFVMWFEILFGWVASLMLVAAVTRLASRD